MHKYYSRQSLSFFSVIAPLLVGLDSTPTESHRNTTMALLLVSMVSTPTELLESPLWIGSLSLLFPYSFFIFSNFFHFFFHFL